MFTLEACGLPAAPINMLNNTIMFNEERIFFFFFWDLQIHTSSAAKNEECTLRMALEERPWGRPTLTALKQHECIQQIKWQSDYLPVRHLKFRFRVRPKKEERFYESVYITRTLLFHFCVSVLY